MPLNAPLSIVLLTFNSERTLNNTLEAALSLSTDVHVVDSYSTDKTIDILKSKPVNWVQHAFSNYGSQRNWAIENLSLKYAWELHLDADERPTEALIREISALNLEQADHRSIDGYFIPRRVYFMGHPIVHGGMYPIYHLRLFRHGKGFCEVRPYDQHFVVRGSTTKLREPFIDDIQMSLEEWTTRHNRWSNAEAQWLLGGGKPTDIQPKLLGNPAEKKRFWRSQYYFFPSLVRPFFFFIYRYFLRCGFLDGKEGLIFFVLQTFWFRFLIDAKIFEAQSQASKAHEL